MKVVHLSSSDVGGGASIACKRISDALRNVGVESNILVQKKSGIDKNVHSVTTGSFSKLSYVFRFTFDESYIRLFTLQNRGRFSNPSIGTKISNHPLIEQADIINLHWINGGYLSLRNLSQLGKLSKPIVWTLHDMWAFTGGCHYNFDCEKFIDGCYSCPSLKYKSSEDLSYKIFQKKKQLYKEFNLAVVTCSKWLAEEAKHSALFKDKRIENIPNPLETEIYKPFSKIESRKNLNLPDDKFLILFGTMTVRDERKGFRYLTESLKLVAQKHQELKNKIEVVVFGSANNDLIKLIPFKVYHYGRFKSEGELVSCYNAADIFIAPSLQDNLPNTVLESISCGTPVVAFNVGGMKDMIEHQKNGYLAELKSVEDLSNGILWFYNNQERMNEYSDYAHRKAINTFDPLIIGERYLNLYKTLI